MQYRKPFKDRHHEARSERVRLTLYRHKRRLLALNDCVTVNELVTKLVPSQLPLHEAFGERLRIHAFLAAIFEASS